MKITITVTDAPEDFDAHELLRGMAERASYGFDRMSSLTVTDKRATMAGTARKQTDEPGYIDF